MSFFSNEIDLQKTMQKTSTSFVGSTTNTDSKTEVLVFPNKISIGCSNSYSGIVPDTTVFREELQWHKLGTEKQIEGWKLLILLVSFAKSFQIIGLFLQKNNTLWNWNSYNYSKKHLSMDIHLWMKKMSPNAYFTIFIRETVLDDSVLLIYFHKFGNEMNIGISKNTFSDCFGTNNYLFLV